MPEYDLAIFDYEDIFVDSERIASQVFAKILNEERGLSLNLTDMFETFVVHSVAQCIQIIEIMPGTKPSSGLEKRYKNGINPALQETITAVEGMEKTLSEITIPCCVASSG